MNRVLEIRGAIENDACHIIKEIISVMSKKNACRDYFSMAIGISRHSREFSGAMGWLWLVGLINLYVSFAKEPYKRDNILQQRPVNLSILLTVATPY